MVKLRYVFFITLTVFFHVLATSASEKTQETTETYDENIRFVFARTLCQDHLKSKTAKMIGHNIGDKICVKPIHCYDPEKGVNKVKLPETSRDGLICKLAFRAEGRIPYICRKDKCVEAPEYKNRLTANFMQWNNMKQNGCNLQ